MVGRRPSKASRRKDPQALADLLPGILKSVRRSRGLDAVDGALADAFGAPLAARIRAVSLREGVLILEVESSALKHHLATFGLEALLEALRHKLPNRPVSEVRFRVGKAP